MLVSNLKKLYSAGKRKNIHPTLLFYNTIVSQTKSQKNLRVTLDFKLPFKEHLLNLFLKVELQNLFSRETLITIYLTFIRSYWGYGYTLYDQVFNNFFHERLEYVQYSTCLAIMGAVRGTSKKKIIPRARF